MKKPLPDSKGELGQALQAGIDALQLSLDPAAQAKLLAYVELLQKWNRIYNLTAIRDAERIVSVHLLDSLAVVPYASATRALDVGTGAGLPGIPLAIARPGLSVSLLDSNQKKTAFLRQAVAQLPLPNAEVVCERVEAWQSAERFPLVFARAFSTLAELALRCRHLLAPGGRIAAMKGVFPEDEVRQLPPGFRMVQSIRLSVPGLAAERHLVFLEAP